MGKLCFSHPGKLGDALLSLPTAIHICKQQNKTADFYTSEYCRPLCRLFEYQDCIDELIIPEGYVIDNMATGVQPWYMPIDESKYDKVYQLGFRRGPDRPLMYFFAYEAGLPDWADVKYKLQYPDIPTLDEPYIILGARHDWEFRDIFKGVIEQSPVKVVLVGAIGEDLLGFEHPNIHSILGLDFLDTTSWISKSLGYVGLMSSMSCLSHQFPIPKVLLRHDDHSWDITQAMKGPYNFYPIMPSPQDVLKTVGF
jgi:hypothetical protein